LIKRTRRELKLGQQEKKKSNAKRRNKQKTVENVVNSSKKTK